LLNRGEFHQAKGLWIRNNLEEHEKAGEVIFRIENADYDPSQDQPPEDLFAPLTQDDIGCL
jgi:hypothetical protein